MSLSKITIQLLRLRFFLVWASIRKSPVRIFFFFLLCLLGLQTLIGAGTTGMFLSILLRKRGLSGSVMPSVFQLLFWGGIFLPILLGSGPPAALLDETLCAYPVPECLRKGLRILSGMMEPWWLGMAIFSLAFAVTGARPWQGEKAKAAISVLELLVTSYLLSQVLLILLRRALSSGRDALKAVAVALGSAMAAGIGPVAAWAPPGLAARACLGHRPWLLFLLTLEMAGTAGFFLTLEGGEASGRRKALGRPSAFLVTQRLLPGSLGAIFAKAMTYQLRCNRVRLGFLLTGPLLVIYLEWIGRHLGAHGLEWGCLAGVAVASLLGLNSININLYGYDGDGFVRYLIAPVPPRTIMLGHAIASFILGLGLAEACLVLFLALGQAKPVAAFPLNGTLAALAGSILVSGGGALMSVLDPHKEHFQRIRGNNRTLLGNGFILGGLALGLTWTFLAGRSSLDPSVLPRFAFVWAPLALANFFVLIKVGSKRLERRKEWICDQLR